MKNLIKNASTFSASHTLATVGCSYYVGQEGHSLEALCQTHEAICRYGDFEADPLDECWAFGAPDDHYLSGNLMDVRETSSFLAFSFEC